MSRAKRWSTALTKLSDREMMQRAIDEARKCLTEPDRVSPKVGALAAEDGQILATAYRGEIEEGEHAEFVLLERKLAGRDVSSATVFTTLEPCTVRNEPKVPCADRLIDRRVSRVVIGSLDHNPAIRGSGELRLQDEGVAVARFDSDLVREISILNEEFVEQYQPVAGFRDRRKPAAHLAPDDRGPNGYRVGLSPEGDLVEWIPDEEFGEEPFPMILRRNEATIGEQYNEFWDKVWWNRHMVAREKGQALPDRAYEAAREIEAKYGRENLGWSDFEWGLISGRMSALAWVLGAEWDESLDT